MSRRQDTGGMGSCNTCLGLVRDVDACRDDCCQNELTLVLKHIADRIGDGGGRVYDDLRELHAELMGGVHR